MMRLHTVARTPDHHHGLDDDVHVGSERLDRPPVSAIALPAQGDWTPSTRPAVQLFATAVSAGIHDVHRLAAHGFGGSSVVTPHLSQVQRAFGRHDVSGVRAYVGGPATEASDALGAHAYAAGDQVAFAHQPDLFLVAHELAHVVQQRGGVQLSSGIGAAGDEYERHADAVAETVVRGDSAETLLDRYAGGARPARGLQFQLGHRRGHGREREHGATRAPPVERTQEQVDRLVADTIGAIAANETGGAAVAPQSRMGTSSGTAASYGSATQMIATHAVGVLEGAGSDVAEAHGVDGDELDEARRIDRATRQIWHILVEEQQPISAVPQGQRARAHLTDAQLEQMVAFGRVRSLLLAQRPAFPARVAAVQAALEARAQQAAAHLDELAAPPPAAEPQPADAGPPSEAATATEPETETHRETEADPQAEPAPDVDPVALTSVLSSRAMSGLGPLGGVATPRRWERWTAAQRTRWLTQQRRLLERARSRIPDLADSAASAMLSRELSSDPDAAALHLDESDIRAYIHDGDFNRFGEDRAAWIRTAMRQVPEAHPDGGTTRSLDEAIASAVEAGGGWELSRAEYDAWIRSYIADHPTATDEQVVRAAAAHNGHSREYPDRIWARFQRIHTAVTPTVTDAGECSADAPPLTTTLQ